MKKSELRQLVREAIRENVPDNITSVIDDMTITMGEEAFITAVFEALPLETAKSVLRSITKANPIQHPSGPVDYDWLNENDYPTSAPRVYVLMLGNRSRGTMGPYRVYADRAAAEACLTRRLCWCSVLIFVFVNTGSARHRGTLEKLLCVRADLKNCS